MTKEEYKIELKKEFKEYMVSILNDGFIFANIHYKEYLELCYEVLDEFKMLNKSNKLKDEIEKYFKEM